MESQKLIKEQNILPINKFVNVLYPLLAFSSRIIISKQIKDTYEKLYNLIENTFQNYPDSRDNPPYEARAGGIEKFTKRMLDREATPRSEKMKVLLRFTADIDEKMINELTMFFDEVMYMMRVFYGSDNDPADHFIVSQNPTAEFAGIPVDKISQDTVIKRLSEYSNEANAANQVLSDDEDIPKVHKAGAIKQIMSLQELNAILMWIGTPFTTRTQIATRLDEINEELQNLHPIAEPRLHYSSYIFLKKYDPEYLNRMFSFNSDFANGLDKLHKNFNDNYDRVVGSPEKIFQKRRNLLKQVFTYIDSNFHPIMELPSFGGLFNKDRAPFAFRTLPTQDSQFYKLLRTSPLGLAYYAELVRGIVVSAFK